MHSGLAWLRVSNRRANNWAAYHFGVVVIRPSLVDPPHERNVALLVRALRQPALPRHVNPDLRARQRPRSPRALGTVGLTKQRIAFMAFCAKD